MLKTKQLFGGLLLCLVVLMMTSVSVTAVTLEWEARYNSTANDDDMAYDVAVDEGGNVSVTGESFNGTDFDYATIKYDSAGAQVWAKNYNGTGNGDDNAKAIAVDSSGNVYVTGRSTGNLTGFDYMTIKYDATAGTQLWVARYDGPSSGDDRAVDIAVGCDGYVYVTGTSEGDIVTIKYDPVAGNIAWGAVARYAGGNGAALVVSGGSVYVAGTTSPTADYVTIKYSDFDGSQLWATTFNGVANAGDYACDIAVDYSGNAYVTGKSYGGAATGYDYATVKYNTAGTQQWAKVHNGPSSVGDSAEAIVVDCDGNVYVTGYTNSANAKDYTTIKYDTTTGNQLWKAVYNHTKNRDDHALAIAIDDCDHVYVTGRSDDTSPGTYYDYATVKYHSETGAQLWLQRHDGLPANFDDYAYAIAVDDDYNVYVTGFTDQLSSASERDYATLKYSQLKVDGEIKWLQLPDASPTGIDIRVDRNDEMPRTLADDFECDESGLITDVHIWGSWKDDIKGRITTIHLSIHGDIPDPDGEGPGYSMPNDPPLWEMDFTDFNESLYYELPAEEFEWWLDPFTGVLNAQGDQMIWQYDIKIDPSIAFYQKGTIDNPIVYWLDVWVKTDGEGEFGWKTSLEHWNDDAVWNGDGWLELIYPEEHPMSPNSIDMAFAITTSDDVNEPNNIKWSQPPVLWQEPDIYIGWDEIAHNAYPVMVADDFLCDSNAPITAIRWWGSFFNWYDNIVPPVETLPKAFYLTIWNDIPAGDPEKWVQLPDETENGIDIRLDCGDGQQRSLADDFECTQEGPITDIHIWGSWKYDHHDPTICDIAQMNVSIYSDDPIGPGGSDPGNIYSKPDQLLWSKLFNTNEIHEKHYLELQGHEWWWDIQEENVFPTGDQNIWRYDLYIDRNEAFIQEGTPTAPTIYWLVIDQVQLFPYGDPQPEFGWKTRQWPDHYQDDAVWSNNGAAGPWNELHYPVYVGHPYEGDSIDLAFMITTDAYSHPNEIIWDNYCTTSDVNFYGWEYDPHFGMVEMPKFEFYQELNPDEYWVQPNDIGVYWLGIMAIYPNDPDGSIPDPCYPFGWETRPHFYNDDAVRLFEYPTPGMSYPMEMFEPIEFDGNSWDMSFELITEPCEPEPDLDFGDAPDRPYPTLLLNGARHIIVPNFMLGTVIDSEPDGQPDPQALGDDLLDGNDDEDGVTFIGKLIPGNLARVDVFVTLPGGVGSALLNAWIDFNGDGVWVAGEQIFTDQVVVAGNNKLVFLVSAPAILGPTFARFRLDTAGMAGGMATGGLANDGEVEDYMVDIEDLTCDWPTEEPNDTKWVQMPDESDMGIDIRLDRNDEVPRVLADDFECNETGRITDVHFWGSWLSDNKGTIDKITIAFYNDLPAGALYPESYSRPNDLVWMMEFGPGQFEEKFYTQVHPGEWWWDPNNQILIPNGDQDIWQYNICIDPCEAFHQCGIPEEPLVYWLAIKVDLLAGSQTQFGWKTSLEHWNDDAVLSFSDGMPMSWIELRYPPQHPMEEQSVDLAFALTIDSNDCYTGPDYAEWATVGKPACWCCTQQCHGDASCSQEEFGKGNYVWVGFDDIDILLDGYSKPDTDPNFNIWICADFDHAKEEFGKGNYVRVGFNDIDILLNYYSLPDANVPADCQTCNPVSP